MNADTINKMLRTAIGYAIAYAVGKGWITAADASSLTEPLVVIGAFVLHAGIIAYTNRKSAKLVTTAAVPGVKAIIMDTKSDADAIPAANVIGPKDPLPSAKPAS